MHTTVAEAEELVSHLQRFGGTTTTAIIVGLIVEINGKLLGADGLFNPSVQIIQGPWCGYSLFSFLLSMYINTFLSPISINEIIDPGFY